MRGRTVAIPPLLVPAIDRRLNRGGDAHSPSVLDRIVAADGAARILARFDLDDARADVLAFTGWGHAPRPDLVRALSTLPFPDYLGIRLDSSRIGDGAVVMNLVTPDNGESFVVPMVNRSLTGAAPAAQIPTPIPAAIATTSMSSLVRNAFHMAGAGHGLAPVLLPTERQRFRSQFLQDVVHAQRGSLG